MAEIQKYSITEELKKADVELKGSPSLTGMTSLTFPGYINSMRSTMFTSHLKQFLTLLKPQVPYFFTNNENLVGKYSSGYKKAPNELLVFRKVGKFSEILDEVKVYKLFVFDKEKQMYDVIERKVCEDLTENFGFDYINDVIDSFKEGDTINKDTVMYRSTSYDEDMNYGYGRNVLVAYTLEPFTSEDAAIASRSLSEEMSSIETETIKIGLNTNDVFVNLHGDKHNYKVIPDIGEMVSDKLAVIRRQFNNQLLFDFKDSSLREILDSDDIIYIDKNEEVIDISIYNNNDERNDSPFYTQINKYIDGQQKYYEEILDACEEIINSGYDYSRDIDYLYKRALEMLNSEKKWRDGDNVFGNIVIEIQVRRVAPLAKGSKVTGRAGNKSVIADIWDDDKMPVTADGRRVDLLLNLLAIINRTTAMPLFEMFINGSSYKIRQKMKSLDTFEEKENLLFKYIMTVNEDQCNAMYSDYLKLSKKDKKRYIEDAIEDGIYIHQPSMWEKEPIFYRCQKIRKVFPFIQMD